MISDINKDNNIPSETKNTENLEKLEKLKNLLNSENNDLYEILSLRDQINLNPKEEEEINNSIWQKQYISIFPLESSTNKPNLSMINLLLSIANKYQIKNNEKINQVKNLQEEANNFIKEIKKAKTIEELNSLKQKVENIKINLDEYFIQREMKIKNNIIDESESEEISNKNNQENKNNEYNKIKTHKRRKHKKREDEYENDFVEDKNDESEDDSEKLI